MVVKTLEELSTLLGGRVADPKDASLEIEDVTGLDGTEGHVLQRSIAFAEKPEVLEQVQAAGFGAVVVPENMKTAIPAITVKNTRVAFAQLLELFYPRRRFEAGISTKACVADSAKVDPSSYIGPFAVIGENAEIGPECEIHAHAKIGSKSKVGAGTRLMAGVLLKDSASIGCKCLAGPLTEIAPGAYIGDDVEIGARCRIGRSRIGSGVRIDNMADIGDEVFIEPLAIVISQNCIRDGAHLGKLSITAGQSLVYEGRSIGDFATAAARTGVDKDIPAGQAVWSGPSVMPHKAYMRQTATRLLPLKHWQKIKELSQASQPETSED